jgi:hypothetical protein
VNPRLSVLLPTVQAWPTVKVALEAALAQDGGEPFEILLLDGHGAGLCREPDHRVRWLRVPGADVFELRALGVAAARGEIIAISEDHCVMPPGWCGKTLAAHRENSVAALVGPVSNHADSARRAVDRASFLLTMGPFAPPLRALTTERLPVPTNLSFKRSALPLGTPAPGWLEYEFLADLHRRNELGLAVETVLEHRQSWGYLRAPLIHFHSGRSYGGSTRAWPPALRRQWFRELRLLPHRMFRFTRSSLERGAGGAVPGMGDRGWLIALILANAFGQLAGAVAGAGASRRRLA